MYAFVKIRGEYCDLMTEYNFYSNHEKIMVESGIFNNQFIIKLAISALTPSLYWQIPLGRFQAISIEAY